MPVFVPHKTLIEVLWYGGMSIPEIDDVLADNKYNRLSEQVYKDIIAGVSTTKWKKAHAANTEVYAFNKIQSYFQNLKSPYYAKEDFSNYIYPDIVYDAMTYVTGAKWLGLGHGSTKVMKLFVTTKLRRFVEMATMTGMPGEAIRNFLASLEPNYGVWSVRVVLVYCRIFFNATPLSMKNNSIRMCDIRDYYALDPESRFYEPYMAHMEASEEDVLSYFGLVDYSAIKRNNKALHGKIASKIMNYFDNVSKKIIPSDYVKLYVHLDTKIQEIEGQDQGTEAYRTEIKRMFERLEHMKEDYKTMDELYESFIAIDPTIETDEPYIKEEK